jgi:steroid 5-alpha reductase family enzyme
MKAILDNKIFSLILILIMYVIAFGVGYIVYINLPYEFYFSFLVADIVATVIIFIFSLIFRNASCYDAYWSVLPLCAVIMLLLTSELNPVRILISIAVIGWGLRLTINWIYTFDNLKWIDWRYREIKEQSKKLYPFVNLFGIHMFPTIVVYFCFLPVLFVFNYDVEINPFVIIFFILAILSFTMQGLADIQMHKFRKNRDQTFIRRGLWKYSRHPNYLGEILMWWMVALFSIFALVGNYYFLIIGAIINTCLFLFISIPLAENHQRSRKEGFDEYKSETRMLLPIYKRKK